MKIRLFGLALIVLSSCTNIRMSKYESVPALTKIPDNNQSYLNGRYSNAALLDDTAKGLSLWENLFPKAKQHDNWKDAEVEFQFEKEYLHANLYSQGRKIDSFQTTFKAGDDYLDLKRKWSTHFVAGPVLWALGDWKVYLATDPEQDLVLFRAAGGSAMLFVLPVFPAEGQTYLVYKKVN